MFVSSKTIKYSTEDVLYFINLMNALQTWNINEVKHVMENIDHQEVKISADSDKTKGVVSINQSHFISLNILSFNIEHRSIYFPLPPLCCYKYNRFHSD